MTVGDTVKINCLSSRWAVGLPELLSGMTGTIVEVKTTPDETLYSRKLFITMVVKLDKRPKKVGNRTLGQLWHFYPSELTKTN